MTEKEVAAPVVPVHRFRLDDKSEIHAYRQPYKGEMKAHVRVAYIGKDGEVGYSPKGIALPPSLLDELLRAVVLLAIEKDADE